MNYTCAVVDTDPEHHGQVLHRCVVEPDATLFGSPLIVLYRLGPELALEHLQETLPNPPTFAVSFKIKVIRTDFAEACFEVVGGLGEMLLAEADTRVPFLRRRDVSLARTELLPSRSSPSLPTATCLRFNRLVAFTFAGFCCLFSCCCLLLLRGSRFPVYLLRQCPRSVSYLLHGRAALLTP